MSKPTEAIPYSTWIEMFKKHPVLIAPSKNSFSNARKKEARIAIAAELSGDFNLQITESQVQRSFSNKKTRLLEKTDKRTGNVEPNLSDVERVFEKFLQGEDPLQSTTVRKLSFGESSSTNSTNEIVEDYIPCSASSSSFDLDAEVALITEPCLRMESPAASPSPTTMMGTLRMASPASSGKRCPPPHSRPPPPKRVKSEEDNLRMEVLREQLKYYKAKNKELNNRKCLEDRVKRLEALLNIEDLDF